MPTLSWWQQLARHLRAWLRPAGPPPGAHALPAPASPASATTTRGNEGEALAAAWLERELHFRIVARNWRNPADRRDELDLVARDGDVLVFIEVKTRAPGALVPGYFAATTPAKKRVLRRAATAYLRGLPAPGPRTWRFDVVEIALAPDRAAEVLHFANVPLFGKHFRG